MLKGIRGVVVVLLCLAAWPQKAAAQTFKVIDIAGLESIIKSPSDKVQVINFWATWCAPCIKELPLFEQAHKTRSDVQVRLVSMDADLDPGLGKVRRFLTKKPLASSVYVLKAENPNSWIDRVDASWSGALPATLFVNPKTGKRKFVEGQLHGNDLAKWIASVK